MEPEARFIEVDHFGLACGGEHLSGDLFHSRSLEDGHRVVSVLADGLSSGVEAAVLASVTASMALEYVEWNIDTAKAAAILMDSLPVDPVRRISYSTFTIVDARRDGRTRVFEHGNPPFLLIRDGAILPLESTVLSQPRWGNRRLIVSEFQSRVGDRLVLCSDGVTQSGMGTPAHPLGWGEPQAAAFALDWLARDPDLSSRRLAELLVDQALGLDGGEAGDDITCGVIHLRRPRILHVLTGPPFDRARDRDFAALVEAPGARKVVCGGTTSNILARELNRDVEMDLSLHDRDVPAPSTMAGVELVTEGCLTLAKVGEYLEAGACPRRNAASRLVELLLESDVIHFQVGTAVNEAHQDPALPVELDIRRNVIKRIAALLETRHLKKTLLSYY
ncbi:SpoIIE family protein phosphatase [Mesoterricola silvestris]|uniref:Serine/threonine phosphatase n=1 Tax=Mesoterricola silvestris TaxID=2927979 RepID=A0AA48H3P6_9BACT|nr:SpoIIE family protein phosphatase [Mesoterricola silvestris]BDU71328.1 serine/threonine phosphatase [Mesoterricola silvestris]